MCQVSEDSKDENKIKASIEEKSTNNNSRNCYKIFEFDSVFHYREKKRNYFSDIPTYIYIYIYGLWILWKTVVTNFKRAFYLRILLDRFARCSRNLWNLRELPLRYVLSCLYISYRGKFLLTFHVRTILEQ